MFKKLGCVLGVAVATLWCAVPANATSYLFHFDYTAPDGMTGDGTFTTSYADTSRYVVTDISGTSDGSAITGLSSYGGANQELYLPPTYFHFVDFAGISFVDLLGDSTNISFNGSQYTVLSSSIDTSGSGSGSHPAIVDITFTGTIGDSGPPGETPLPSSLLLFGSIIGIGFVAKRKMMNPGIRAGV